MSEKTAGRLVIIDGKSVFYRGYYAMGALSLPDGTPTGGVYGFAAIAMELVKKLQPTHVVVAWDSKTSAESRRKIYPEYKAGRVKPGEDFYAQIPLLKDLIIALGWGFMELDEYEADDIIGSLSRQADEELLPDGTCRWMTYIVSSDLDMLQIVDENTRMYRILKGFSDLEELDVPAVEAKYGIRKEQFLDLKALKGDASDNIPGVPGIGEKGAAKLLEAYGDLDGIYEHIDEITGATQKKLVAGKDLAYMSRELAQIKFEAPVKLADVPEFVVDRGRIVKELERLQFGSLIKKFGLGKAGNIVSSGHASRQPVVTGAARSFSPVSSERSREKDISSFTIPEDLFIAYDVKESMHQDERVAGEILDGRKFWDLGQADFLLNPLRRGKMLQVDLPEEVYRKQVLEFEKLPELSKIFTEFDLPLIPVLYKMEKRGMLIDREYFEELKKKLRKKIESLQMEAIGLAGRVFNLNSPVQLAEVLFGDLGLPTIGIKKTKRGYSTGAKELEKLAGAHPIIEKIQEYRMLAKLLSTYVVPLVEQADENGRVHTTFTQDVTSTGRLSSLNPNLQNIPVRTAEGKQIRTGFVAAPGKKLVSADYSQFELRLAAVLSGDEQLIRDFNEGIDIHTKTAAAVAGVPMEQVTKQQRRAAKVVNFGILYGMSARTLGEGTGMTTSDAKRFIDKYFELREPVKRYLEKTLAQAKTEGFVETYYGRRRSTPDVKAPNFQVRAAAERAAQNMPIQGTEADLMKRAMIRINDVLPEGADLVMQVHDSLIVECDEGLVEEVGKILRMEMEGVAPELDIKLAVEVTSGDNWGEL